MSAGGRVVKQRAQVALDAGTDQALRDFIERGWQQAKDVDDRIATGQAMSAGGPEVQAAAQKALDGTPEDVRYFLAIWRGVAAAGDTETTVVTQQIDAVRAALARKDKVAAQAALANANRVATDARKANTARLATQQSKAQSDAQAGEARPCGHEIGRAHV